ncbi:O-methyltransferase [Grosmannia clavigera kw1407]|uniref:O-methyltransferase n=1 Tax=Grosmannia clavigera (strain kw1407 / UAMH 11150) TaxID=655863 RepID=F0XE18_GROCL|nr:O-methyltransferase [Grosmannia clavigera kw1407]EFX04259.1 O-methyltransferase [Grosmannia clavigera kw1407]
MSVPNALQGVSPHVRELLSRLHAESLEQEAALAKDDMSNGPATGRLMRDKFIALDENKAHYVYQLARATGATTIVEAGTSFGVSTIYLALAAAANAAINSSGSRGSRARVIGTEHEPTKAARAREHWRQCGDTVADVIELREGDLRETLRTDLDKADMLLLDIWTPMALPTLKIVQPKLRYGAVVITDNTISSAAKYKEYLDYIRATDSGFSNMTVPFKGGLEISVYLPAGGGDAT